MLSEFHTTNWSLVLDAREEGSTRSREALSALCTAYWEPLYVFIRRQGHDPDEARDLTQSYFASLLERRSLRNMDPDAGRFRSFLLASLKHHLSDERDKARAQKRGAGRAPITLDVNTAERAYAIQPSHQITPETLFEKKWALTVLRRALSRLRDEFTRDGGERQFELLKDYLLGGENEVPYRQVAGELEMTEAAVKMAVYRLRKRFGKSLRAEIADTVADEAQVDDEVYHLLSVLRI
jgi:RNA polymerase sigma factor (sigma-70 family)